MTDCNKKHRNHQNAHQDSSRNIEQVSESKDPNHANTRPCSIVEKAVISFFKSRIAHRNQMNLLTHLSYLKCYLYTAPSFVFTYFFENYPYRIFNKFFLMHPSDFRVDEYGYVHLVSNRQYTEDSNTPKKILQRPQDTSVPKQILRRPDEKSNPRQTPHKTEDTCTPKYILRRTDDISAFRGLPSRAEESPRQILNRAETASSAKQLSPRHDDHPKQILCRPKDSCKGEAVKNIEEPALSRNEETEGYIAKFYFDLLQLLQCFGVFITTPFNLTNVIDSLPVKLAEYMRTFYKDNFVLFFGKFPKYFKISKNGSISLISRDGNSTMNEGSEVLVVNFMIAILRLLKKYETASVHVEQLWKYISLSPNKVTALLSREYNRVNFIGFFEKFPTAFAVSEDHQHVTLREKFLATCVSSVPFAVNKSLYTDESALLQFFVKALRSAKANTWPVPISILQKYLRNAPESVQRYIIDFYEDSGLPNFFLHNKDVFKFIPSIGAVWLASENDIPNVDINLLITSSTRLVKSIIGITIADLLIKSPKYLKTIFIHLNNIIPEINEELSNYIGLNKFAQLRSLLNTYSGMFKLTKDDVILSWPMKYSSSLLECVDTALEVVCENAVGDDVIPVQDLQNKIKLKTENLFQSVVLNIENLKTFLTKRDIFYFVTPDIMIVKKHPSENDAKEIINLVQNELRSYPEGLHLNHMLRNIQGYSFLVPYSASEIITVALKFQDLFEVIDYKITLKIREPSNFRTPKKCREYKLEEENTLSSNNIDLMPKEGQQEEACYSQISNLCGTCLESDSMGAFLEHLIDSRRIKPAVMLDEDCSENACSEVLPEDKSGTCSIPSASHQREKSASKREKTSVKDSDTKQFRKVPSKRSSFYEIFLKDIDKSMTRSQRSTDCYLSTSSQKPSSTNDQFGSRHNKKRRRPFRKGTTQSSAMLNERNTSSKQYYGSSASSFQQTYSRQQAETHTANKTFNKKLAVKLDDSPKEQEENPCGTELVSGLEEDYCTSQRNCTAGENKIFQKIANGLRERTDFDSDSQSTKLSSLDEGCTESVTTTTKESSIFHNNTCCLISITTGRTTCPEEKYNDIDATTSNAAYNETEEDHVISRDKSTANPESNNISSRESTANPESNNISSRESTANPESNNIGSSESSETNWHELPFAEEDSPNVIYNVFGKVTFVSDSQGILRGKVTSPKSSKTLEPLTVLFSADGPDKNFGALEVGDLAVCLAHKAFEGSSFLEAVSLKALKKITKSIQTDRVNCSESEKGSQTVLTGNIFTCRIPSSPWIAH